MSISLSKTLRMVDGKPGHLIHWCNYCGKAHQIDIHAISRDGRVNGWDGTFVNPTIGEPIRHEHDGQVCEYMIRGGSISYLESSTHDGRGKTERLPEFP